MRPNMAHGDSRQGILLALTAFLIWSCFPFYFKRLGAYEPLEIIVHRIVWTFVLLGVFLLACRHWQGLALIKQQPKWLVYTAISGLLIAGNWLTYVWAVSHAQILAASLGYFISPLFGVALSYFVLKEPLRPLQTLALGLAVLGVLVQLILLGSIPVVAIALAATFSVYGLMHRKTPLDSLTALFIETAILAPFGIMWLANANVASSQWGFWYSDAIFLLMLAGPVTLVPLLLYNKATKLVNFNTLSFMNYLTPSLIFLIAIGYYQEHFAWSHFAVFGLIWAGLGLFSWDMFWQQMRRR